MRPPSTAGAFLALALAALPIAPAPAQIHAFHAEIQGIYWNPELNGWGFSFDVQKGSCSAPYSVTTRPARRPSIP